MYIYGKNENIYTTHIIALQQTNMAMDQWTSTHSNSKYIYFLKDRLLVWGSVILIKGNQPPTKINPTRLFF